MVFEILKIKKSTVELGHSDLLSVYKSSFAQMPISHENMNVFLSDSITMVPEWNHLIFMQIDYPRWPPGAVTKNSMNTKMTISKEPLVEIDPFCARMFLVWSHFDFLNGTISNLCKLTSQDGHQGPLLKIA